MHCPKCAGLILQGKCWNCGYRMADELLKTLAAKRFNLEESEHPTPVVNRKRKKKSRKFMDGTRFGVNPPKRNRQWGMWG